MPDADAAVALARAAESRRQRARRRVRLGLWLVASVLMANALIGERGLLALLQARERGANLLASVAAMRRENTRLREVARRLREDPHAIEELARRELGLVKPGELLFIIKDIPPPDSESFQSQSKAERE